MQGGIFHYAKQITEAHAGAGTIVRDAVIAVPAWLGIPERQAMLSAASLGGLNVLALINAHSAAALQFGIERDFTKGDQKVGDAAAENSYLIAGGHTCSHML